MWRENKITDLQKSEVKNGKCHKKWRRRLKTDKKMKCDKAVISKTHVEAYN